MHSCSAPLLDRHVGPAKPRAGWRSLCSSLQMNSCNIGGGWRAGGFEKLLESSAHHAILFSERLAYDLCLIFDTSGILFILTHLILVHGLAGRVHGYANLLPHHWSGVDNKIYYCSICGIAPLVCVCRCSRYVVCV